MESREGFAESVTSGGFEGSTIVRVKLADVKRDEGLMMRVRVNEEAVEEYAEKYQREKVGTLAPGEKPFPLCVLFRTPEGVLLVHGWHRIDAMDRAGIEEWAFDVRTGSRADAAQFAAKANKESTSVRYTNADKRNAVHRLLAVPELSERSDQFIADLCGVDHKTVTKYRTPEDKEQPKKGKDGKVRKPSGAKPRSKSKAATREVPKSDPTSEAAGGPSESTVDETEASPVEDASEILGALGASTTAEALTRITEMRQQEHVAEAEVERLRQQVAKLEKQRDALMKGALGDLFRELGVTGVKDALAAVRELKSNAAA